MPNYEYHNRNKFSETNYNRKGTGLLLCTFGINVCSARCELAASSSSQYTSVNVGCGVSASGGGGGGFSSRRFGKLKTEHKNITKSVDLLVSMSTFLGFDHLT